MILLALCIAFGIVAKKENDRAIEESISISEYQDDLAKRLVGKKFYNSDNKTTIEFLEDRRLSFLQYGYRYDFEDEYSYKIVTTTYVNEIVFEKYNYGLDVSLDAKGNPIALEDMLYDGIWE